MIAFHAGTIALKPRRDKVACGKRVTTFDWTEGSESNENLQQRNVTSLLFTTRSQITWGTMYTVACARVLPVRMRLAGSAQ